MNMVEALVGEALGGAIASMVYILKVSPFLLLGMLLFRLGVVCIRKQIALLKLLQTPQQIDLLKLLQGIPDIDLEERLDYINSVLRNINEKQL